MGTCNFARGLSRIGKASQNTIVFFFNFNTGLVLLQILYFLLYLFCVAHQTVCAVIKLGYHPIWDSEIVPEVILCGIINELVDMQKSIRYQDMFVLHNFEMREVVVQLKQHLVNRGITDAIEIGVIELIVRIGEVDNVWWARRLLEGCRLASLDYRWEGD